MIDIYDQFVWANADDKHDPEKVLEQIHAYCNPRKNEVLESHRFWCLRLEDFPLFEHFLTELRKKAETCNFGETDRMIRDKIVFSASGKLQELLRREDKLDLPKCLQICRAFEQSNKHVQEIRRDRTSTEVVNKVDNHKQKSQKNNHKGAKPKKPNVSKPMKQKIKCHFCGYSHEKGKEKCPAWGEKCNNCSGRNHFKSCCKKVNSLEKQQEDSSGSEEEFWLHYINGTVNSKVKAKMLVNNCEVQFQIDTGAEINTIQ